MRKLFVIMMLMAGGMAARAADYAYLTFEATDGSKVSVPVASLSLTLSGTTLTAGSETFQLAGLAKMYFTAYDETSDIRALTFDELDDAAEVYDLQGRRVERAQMAPGTYIIKTRRGADKIVVL